MSPKWLTNEQYVSRPTYIYMQRERDRSDTAILASHWVLILVLVIDLHSKKDRLDTEPFVSSAKISCKIFLRSVGLEKVFPCVRKRTLFDFEVAAELKKGSVKSRFCLECMTIILLKDLFEKTPDFHWLVWLQLAFLPLFHPT